MSAFPVTPSTTAGRGFRTALKIGFSAVLLALLFSQVDWARAAPMLREVRPWPILVLLGIYAADRVLMALKWHQLLHVLDTRLSRLAAIRVYYESSFVGFAMPLGGIGPDIVRYLRLRGRAIPSHVTLVSIVVERYVGMIATLVLVAVGFTALAAIAPEPALRRFAGITAAVALAAAVSGGALLVPGVRSFAKRLLARSRRLEQAIAKHTEAAAAYSSRRRVLAVNFALSLLEQTAPIWTYWVGSRALGMPLPLVVCLAVAPVNVVMTRLPISYGGLGLREGSAAALLVALGYDYSEALVLLMLLFVVFTVSLLPGAVIFKRDRSSGEKAAASAPGTP